MFSGGEDDEKNLVLSRAKGGRPCFIYMVTLLSAIGGFLFGYDTGVVSGSMILLKDTFELSYIWQELVVSVTIAAAWLFSLISGILTDRIGRKPVIILASFVFTVGAVLMGLAYDKWMLLSGRIVVGVGIGFASMSVPMYIAEVSPPDIRGQLVTLNNCFITGGQFAASIVSGGFSKDSENGWRYMLGLAGIPSFIQFFGFLTMPESPRWLVSRGRYQEAYSALRRIRGPTAKIEEELEVVKANCLEMESERAAAGSSPVLVQVWRNPALRRALIVGCALQLFQQLAGINTVMYYSATILQMSGIKDRSRVIWLSAATASVNFVCTFIGLAAVERVGRRPLTLASLSGVIISLCVLAVGFQVANIYSPSLNAIDPVDANYTCQGYSTCGQCVNSIACGYCYDDMPWGPANGSCLLTTQDTIDRSLGGRCNNTNLKDPLTWAYEWCPTDYGWITILGLLMYLFFFAPGMGPMPWAINSEIYPLWARSTCYSLATSTNWLFNLVISMTFLTLTEALTKYGTFYLYACIAAVGFVVFFLTLPETKGKSLEEVETLFAHAWWRDLTTADDRKTVQYVHIRGLNHAYTTDDAESGDES